MVKRGIALVWLVAVWTALWKSLSVANLLSGVAVATALLVAFPPEPAMPRATRLRPLGALRFVGFFLRELVRANLDVAREVVTPNNDRVNEGIVAVPVTPAPDALLALVANAISLTPGTLVLEVDREPPVLYLHVLHLDTIEQVHVDVLRMHRAALRAVGSDDAVTDVERRVADAEAAVDRARTSGPGGRQ